MAFALATPLLPRAATHAACPAWAPAPAPPQRCRRASRRAACYATVAPPSAAASAGTIFVHGDTSELAVGDTIVIEYTPAPGSPMARDQEATLLWTGGFNGWRGEGDEQTLHFPLTPLLDGRHRVSVSIPEFAKTLDFCFTDASGYAWDDNAGEYYTVPVKYRKRRDKAGNVIEYVAGEGEDGVGDEKIEIKRDAKVEEEESPVMLPEDERTLHRIRGEAALVGEEQGLGNILISQARDTFDRYDRRRTGTIEVQDIKTALAQIGFELPDDVLDDLIVQFVKSKSICSMVEFMLLYAHLEKSDIGLDFV